MALETKIPTDEQCALEAQKGSTEAFGILVDRYQAKLLRYGRKFLSAREDVEDIVQDVFISVYKKLRASMRRFASPHGSTVSRTTPS